MSLVDIIHFQSYVIMGLVSYAVLLLTGRRFLKAHRRRRKERFSAVLANELCEIIDRKPPPFKVKRTFGVDRSVAQEAMLEQIRLMSGPEREYLVQRYRKQGFLSADLRDCKSWSWGRRLRAVLNLGSLELPELGALFARMMNDRDPMVAVAATLSLSSLPHAFSGPDLLDRLPPALLSRRDALLEVVVNLGVRHGFEGLIERIETSESPGIVEACVRALGHLRPPEAVGALRGALARPAGLTREMACQIISTLSSIGDPSVCEGLRPFMSHPDPVVRSAAAQCLFNLGDGPSMARIRELRKDNSTEMMRILPSLEFIVRSSEEAS